MDFLRFPVPGHKIIFEALLSSDKIVDKTINDQVFNHTVDLLLPNTRLPEEIKQIITDDRSDYVKVRSVPLSLVLNKEFVESFMKTGQLWMISVDSTIDADAAVITPPGNLILSCKKDTYYKLGLQGRHCCRHSKAASKFAITVDLTHQAYQHGRRYYERVQEACHRTKLSFDFIVQWKPRDLTINISSIQRYFAAKGYECIVKHPSSEINYNYSIPVPQLYFKSENIEDWEIETIYEWIGAQICKVKCETESDLMSSLCCPEPYTIADCLVTARWQGFYSTDKIIELTTKIRKVLETTESIPFTIIVVHSYYNGLAVENDRHKCFQSREKQYCIIYFPGKNVWLYNAATDPY